VITCVHHNLCSGPPLLRSADRSPEYPFPATSCITERVEETNDATPARGLGFEAASGGLCGRWPELDLVPFVVAAAGAAVGSLCGVCGECPVARLELLGDSENSLTTSFSLLHEVVAHCRADR